MRLFKNKSGSILELISIEDDRVIIKNNIQNRIAEIVYQRGELYCQLCEVKDCHCIGYVWSIPEIYEKLSWLSREDLIKHFVSAEFNRFLDYYKKSDDIKNIKLILPL